MTLPSSLCALALLVAPALGAELEVGPGQRPPPAVSNPKDCHVAAAKPLLDARAMKKSRDYRLKTLSEAPATLEERVPIGVASGKADLRVVQRGCEDVYLKFEFTYPDEPGGKGLMGPGPALVRAAEGLKTLRTAPEALVSRERLFEIAGALEAKAHSVWQQSPVKGFTGFVACLSHLPKECPTDVAVLFDYPRLRVIYIDRP